MTKRSMIILIGGLAFANALVGLFVEQYPVRVVSEVATVVVIAILVVAILRRKVEP